MDSSSLDGNLPMSSLSSIEERETPIVDFGGSFGFCCQKSLASDRRLMRVGRRAAVRGSFGLVDLDRKLTSVSFLSVHSFSPGAYCPTLFFLNTFSIYRQYGPCNYQANGNEKRAVLPPVSGRHVQPDQTGLFDKDQSHQPPLTTQS